MKPESAAGFHLVPRAGYLPAEPYELHCLCGTKLQGQRHPEAQTVRCPSCSAQRFVLPVSPLPHVAGAATVNFDRGTVTRGRRKLLVGHAVIVGLSLLLGGAITLALVLRGNRPPRGDELTPEEQFASHVKAGRDALAEGAFHRAAAELESAINVGQSTLGRLKDAERRELQQLQRQAALAADLLAEPLADIIRHSIGVPEAEWQEIFRERYLGRSFILDDTIYLDASGRFRHGFKIHVTGAEARLDLDRLKLLDHLSPKGPTRMLFGMRLAGLRRENNGWLILLDPKSGVLITDPQVVTNLSLPLDAELTEVLRRQGRQVADLP